jgi:hypothetical protein
MSVQLADSHLTYIGSSDWRRFNSVATYDVYPRGGGAQMGYVYRRSSGWYAQTMDRDPKTVKSGRTRWEAATALWGQS